MLGCRDYDVAEIPEVIGTVTKQKNKTKKQSKPWTRRSQASTLNISSKFYPRGEHNDSIIVQFEHTSTDRTTQRLILMVTHYTSYFLILEIGLITMYIQKMDHRYYISTFWHLVSWIQSYFTFVNSKHEILTYSKLPIYKFISKYYLWYSRSF